MIAMIGTTHQLLSSVKFPDNPQAHESPYFEPLLEETADRYTQISLVSADSGFLSRDNCDLVEKHGGKPRIYPKKGITLRGEGSWAWTGMLLDFIQNPQEWFREYHL
ncbi:hypothetical protein AKJ63_01260 [candidate division MSBL1 archaeon SCGC-AAA259D18]|uniref:Transposase IS4-like domain-containing protein n=1 Tax=candidate division MSBL1 archaeon SCGC-AAA259D18 TaxID=1698262 RepID=A0A133UBI7_9EURY|nr:hypothetical protein AKJ63_01260 [candidate division MSBL1 archaeon SCGC-AAA259D18]